jgi:hypothetical protein
LVCSGWCCDGARALDDAGGPEAEEGTCGLRALGMVLWVTPIISAGMKERIRCSRLSDSIAEKITFRCLPTDAVSSFAPPPQQAHFPCGAMIRLVCISVIQPRSIVFRSYLTARQLDDFRSRASSPLQSPHSPSTPPSCAARDPGEMEDGPWRTVAAACAADAAMSSPCQRRIGVRGDCVCSPPANPPAHHPRRGRKKSRLKQTRVAEPIVLRISRCVGPLFHRRGLVPVGRKTCSTPPQS